MIDVTISAEGLSATVEQVRRLIEDKEALHLNAAAAVEALWQKHLKESYVPRDKDGVDFWSDVANSMETSATGEQGVVSVEELGINLRYYGGTVTPGKSISSWTGRPTRALALPTERVPVEGGRRVAPGRAGPLNFVLAIEGDIIGYLFAGVVDGTITRGRNKGKPRVRRDGPLMYVLKRLQYYRPDPGIMPKDEDIRAAALEAIGAMVEALG